eukprot:210737-Alexandrium_andersonii.AAC.1
MPPPDIQRAQSPAPALCRRVSATSQCPGAPQQAREGGWRGPLRDSNEGTAVLLATSQARPRG